MGQINLNNFKVITDKLNTFFVDNKFMVASEIPTTGEFKVGDIIINNGPTNVDEPMWICVEAGNPGTWTVFNSGGGSGGGKLTTARNRVVLNGESKSEVSIGVSGFNKASDVLMVFINSRFMTEGVDYEINADSTKIVAIGEVWNEELASEFEIEMIVFKMMGEEGVVSSVNEIVKLKNTVIVNESVNEVEIGIEGFNKGDDLTVYRNSVYMIEGIDYEVQGNKIVSLKGTWNAEGGSDYKFTFEVLKTVAKINPDAVIGMEHLTEDVKEAIQDASNIDLSGYATKEELNELFQNVDNGKNLIATSIGNPLITGNSTFKAMSEAILGLRRESENETDAKDVLYGMMVEDGYNKATSNMTVDELIELLDDSQIDTCAIKQIACGESHVFVLKNDGSIWACGLNDDGQLGLNNNTNKTSFTQVTTNINNDVKEVVCGGNHTFIIKNDGSIWATGYNYFGQLGLNNTVDKNVFTQVYTDITDIKQIACGQNYTIILTNDGSLWACGSNNYGEQGLGTSDYDAHSTFTKVTTNINNDVKEVVCGYHSTYILKNDGSLWACGYNNFGQLGLGNTTTKNKFTQVTSNINNDVKQVVCGINFVYILKNDGTVWSCGCNNFGQLGLGNTTTKNKFTQVTTSINNDVKQISCGGLDVSYGYDQVFILKNDGTVWSCGSNYYGQLGLGDTTDRSVFTQVTTNINNDVKQISCGGGQSFIFKNDGTVWSCGYNNYGQLGLGTSGSNSKKATFTQVSTFSSVEIAEYEINRLKLYYYLLDNEIEVTESMDIGTMLDLLVDDYINNLILGYENNLRIILTDEGVSVTEEDDMASLISKVDSEFDRKNEDLENSRGVLDITTANVLPSNGRKNQICVITDTKPPTIFITPDTTDYNVNDNNMRLFLADDYRTARGGVNIVNSGIACDYYFDRVVQNSKGLDAYVYNNGSWKQFLKAITVAFDYGYSELGISTGGQQVINSNNIIQLYITNAYWVSLCFQQVIDFSKFTTCEITFTGGDSANGATHDFYVMNSGVPTSSINSALTSFSYSEITSPVKVSLNGVSEVTPKTITIDISSLNGSGYFGIINFHQPLTYTTTNISKIIIY